jgi:hypothetical protein
MAQLKELETRINTGKVMATLGDELGVAISGVVVGKGVELTAVSGKFISLVVADGKLTAELIDKVKSERKATTTTTTTTNKKGVEYEYKLSDGRSFPRIVDAIEALTGKPCTLKHDGKVFADGKANLRYSRLTKDIRAKVTRIEKAPAAADTIPTPAAADTAAVK